jgi:LCP family protein required for cell wall assembly
MKQRIQQRKHKEVDTRTNRFWVVGIVLVALVFAVAIGIAMKFGNSTKEAEKTVQVTATEKWQEGIISYKGKYYKYNNRTSTYLLMGIDKSGVVEQSEDYTQGGQSDAIFLLVVDKSANEFYVISVNRNTMTDIEMYTSDGSPLGTYTAQLCLQHGYGDGKRLSCRRTQEAVSKLFDNLPIEGYLSLGVDAIPIINDDMGGIEVTCLQDLSYPTAGVELTEGETVTLNGTEAYYYLRGRDTNTFDSATLRLRREEQYITAFMNKLHNMSGKRETLDTIYEDISDYIVTNISFVDLVSDFSEFTLTEDHVYSVPGETIQGEEFEEFYVDEDGLYDLIIQVFYNEVTVDDDTETASAD